MNAKQAARSKRADRRAWRRLCLSAVLLTPLAAYLSGCAGTKPAAPPQRPPPAVTTASVEQRDIPIYIDEIGRCAATESVWIKPQASGRIMAIHFRDGADVKKGDKLFTIDPSLYEVALQKAISELNENKAEVEQAEANMAQNEAGIERSRAGLKEAEARLGLSQLEFKRSEELVKTDAMPRQDYDQKKMDVEVSQAQVKSTQADLSMSQSQLESSKAAIGVARAKVATSQNEVEAARLNLSYTQVLAPIDGRTGQRLVDIGNVVSAVNPAALLSLQRVEPIYADFTIPESELSRVRAHTKTGELKVEVRAGDATDTVHEGTLSFLDNSVKAETGTVKLRATIPNHERALWPGQFVRVRLILSIVKGALLIPAQAVQISQNGPFAYIVKADSTVEMRPVKTGQRHGDLVAIESGVNAGERVVTTGQMMLFPGAHVKVDTAAAPAEPGGANGAGGVKGAEESNSDGNAPKAGGPANEAEGKSENGGGSAK